MTNIADILFIRSKYKEINRVERKWEILSSEILNQIIELNKLHPTRKKIHLRSNHFSDAEFRDKTVEELLKLGFSCTPHTSSSIVLIFD